MNHLYGLIGKKLSHSYSPKIHFAIMSALNIQGDYELYETDQSSLPLLMNRLIKMGVRGVNVTIPYKIEIMKFLDDISTPAKIIGSVNTLSFTKDGIKGHNTDYDGFKMLLDYYNVSIKGKEFVVLGTGGAAKSVIQWLKDNDAKKIHIVSRDKDQRMEGFLDFEIISYSTLETIKKEVIINCTPCGMYPNIAASPVSLEQIKETETCIDLIYNPTETLFLRKAKSLNIKYINGLYMLIGQAVRAQEIWNDISIDKCIVEKIYQTLSKER